MQTINSYQANQQSCATPLAVIAGAALRYASASPETNLTNDNQDLDVPTPVPPIQPMQPDGGTELVDSNPITPPK